ncbi:hypothetical protein [Frankia nepalensis]|uniref:Ketohydroxyglutarate aldolase n=1 Tax=Frankia nepalensis TaxID=1836974 RepID=A0A937RPS9_9ACTN|nr:hypothetical protein [Frankia nepalensis]MBL7498426.1 ketohydroxyglutarate aldolase [Frankia nepalensis]MBL7509960.1 ketohydroxyglutarate aldolase [Frankia nepalensis]MBL7629756.1 hypothetical protein [Frankia nepalensis]
MEDIGVIVTVDDAYLTRIAEVSAALRANGMHIDQALDDIGVITGSIAGTDSRSLANVEGVKAVEPERSFQLPPSDSPIQ